MHLQILSHALFRSMSLNTVLKQSLDFFSSCIKWVLLESKFDQSCRILYNPFTRMSESNPLHGEKELRSLALTPTWSVASVLTIFVAVSLLVERSIHRLGNWLKKTERIPLLAAVEKMKEELMLLGFMSLFLTATSSLISKICIPSKFYDDAFASCTRKEVEGERDDHHSNERRLLMALFDPQLHRRLLMGLNQNKCAPNHEPFVSYEGLEQLHRFIFVMAVTHISYSCLTMLLAIVKIHSWRAWEDEAHMDSHNTLTEKTRAMTMRRQSTFVRVYTSNPQRNSFFVWVTCFFRQFGRSVVHEDYLTLRQGFIMTHNLTSTHDFHSYMVRSVEEEFQKIVGVSAPLWGFAVVFMLFNVKGSNLYFWIALIPVALVLLVGTKLQHVIATLALESAGITGKFRPRDELFWFDKPKLLLVLIHFILFQNAFELASFFWFWWQLGYNSCFIRNRFLVYSRLVIGFAGQFLCSYSTLPLYALVTQMGTNFKAALIPREIREKIHRWEEAARRRRKHSTIHADTSTAMSDDHELMESGAETAIDISDGSPALLRPSASVSVSSSYPFALRIHTQLSPRASSMPR